MSRVKSIEIVGSRIIFYKQEWRDNFISMFCFPKSILWQQRKTNIAQTFSILLTKHVYSKCQLQIHRVIKMLRNRISFILYNNIEKRSIKYFRWKFMKKIVSSHKNLLLTALNALVHNKAILKIQKSRLLVLLRIL